MTITFSIVDAAFFCLWIKAALSIVNMCTRGGGVVPVVNADKTIISEIVIIFFIKIITSYIDVIIIIHKFRK